MTTPFLFVPTFSWPAAPGGLLYTYAAGGTSAKATYSDAAGSVPNTNPVVLDSNGSATVRLGSGGYHFVLKDSTGSTTLWDQDNYQSSYLTQADIAPLLNQRTQAEISVGVTPTNYAYASGPSRYGASGAGVANDSPAWASMGKVNGYHFVYDGTYLFQSKVQTSAFLTVEGSTRQNTTIQASAFADYVLEIGSVVGGPNPNVGALHRLRFTGGTATNTGLLHMNQLSHMWNLNELLFQSSSCPALVVDNCWDSNYTNIDILSCGATSGTDPSVGAGLIVKNGCNNLYFRGLRVEQCKVGAIYVGTGGPIHIVTGKVDQGFITQNAAAITVASGGGLIVDDFAISGINQQYIFDTAGSLQLGAVVIGGGTAKNAAINDHRAWTHIDGVTNPGASAASIGPSLPTLDLGLAHFQRAPVFINQSTTAAVYSKIWPIRAVAQLQVSANGAVSGNTILVQTNLTAASNDLYDGLYLVHNPTGSQAAGQAGARRKILQSFTNGQFLLQGTWGCTLDSDWSIEYAGNHSTPIRADGITLDQGMDLFAVLATGATISGTPTYQNASAGAAGGATYVTLTATGFAANTDVRGLYLVDEVTGEPFYINYGLDGSSVVAVMYDRTATLNTAHTFSLVAGYHGNVKQNGGSYEWTFAGKKRTALVSAADAAGFDINNIPLWSFGTTGEPVTLPYSASINSDSSAGREFVITATNGTAFTINAPVNLSAGDRILFTIRNTSGGAVGVITWNAIFKMATWTSPATANSRTIEFRYDGTNLVEINRTPNDVPN